MFNLSYNHVEFIIHSVENHSEIMFNSNIKSCDNHGEIMFNLRCNHVKV